MNSRQNHRYILRIFLIILCLIATKAQGQTRTILFIGETINNQGRKGKINIYFSLQGNQLGSSSRVVTNSGQGNLTVRETSSHEFTMSGRFQEGKYLWNAESNCIVSKTRKTVTINCSYRLLPANAHAISLGAVRGQVSAERSRHECRVVPILTLGPNFGSTHQLCGYYPY